MTGMDTGRIEAVYIKLGISVELNKQTKAISLQFIVLSCMLQLTYSASDFKLMNKASAKTAAART
jgi:hypothetical protein